MQLPCGRCVGCRLEYARGWAVRAMHEASMHEANCFLTLTYNDEHLPQGGTLSMPDYQKFLKRYRKRTGAKFSYMLSGEYGDTLGRPHYHALIFGHDFTDKTYLKDGKDGLGRLYTSPLLDELWGMGFATTGEVSFHSASYVARYAMKKITGDEAPGWYTRLDPATGELHDLMPEFMRVSLRRPIGKEWFLRYGREVFPADEIIVNGHQAKPPRYYFKLQQRLEQGPCRPGDTTVSQQVKRERVGTLVSRAARIERGPERLRVKEKVKRAQIQSLKRDLK